MNIVSAASQAENGHNEYPSIAFLFLKSLFKNCGEGLIDFRFFPSGKDLFIPLNGIDSIPSILEAHEEDAFFGVATRNETQNGIIEIPALWIELDFKNLSHEKKEEIRDRYKSFPVRGSFVVLTGGEIDIYWLFKRPISQEKIPQWRDVLESLASYFEAEPGAGDVNRFLRVPGVLNYDHSPPKEVILDVFLPEKQYTLSDFAFLLQAEAPNGEDKEFTLVDEEESAGEDITPKSQGHASEANFHSPPPNPHESDPQTNEQFHDEISGSCDPESWIRLHQKIEKSIIFQNEGLLKVWVWCLIKASHEDQQMPITTGRGTTGVFVKKGQLIFGRKSAAKVLKMGESTVYKRVMKLKRMGYLNIQRNSHYSLITIAGWNDSQSFHERVTGKIAPR